MDRIARTEAVKESPDRAGRSRHALRKARRPKIPRWYLREEQRSAATWIGRAGDRRGFLLGLSALLAALVALSGCPRATRAPVLPERPGVEATTLGAGDLIEVRVFQEPELSGLYQVGGQGDLIFPLCRRVVVGGSTANAAAEKLRACLSEGFLRDPQVTVLVREFNSKKVFVFGEVQKPGTFPYQDGMSVVQAVTLAGGFTKTASQNGTSVTRRVDGQEVKVRVNVQDIALGKAANFMLEPGDIVYVPESLF